jgi:hypothetical protein
MVGKRAKHVSVMTYLHCLIFVCSSYFLQTRLLIRNAEVLLHFLFCPAQYLMSLTAVAVQFFCIFVVLCICNVQTLLKQLTHMHVTVH